MVLLGDFNSPSLSWQPSASCVNQFVPTGVSRENVSLLDGMSVNGLLQLSGTKNICGRQLDLLFANAAFLERCSPVIASPV